MLEVFYIGSRIIATITHKDIDPETGGVTGMESISFEPGVTDDEKAEARKGGVANYPEG
jgi:hypothetical protein